MYVHRDCPQIYRLVPPGCSEVDTASLEPPLTPSPLYVVCSQPLSTQSNPWFKQMIASASPGAKTTGKDMIYQELTEMEVGQK